MRHLVSSDIPDIALGSSLLGAGGGGDPYVGGLIARQALDKAGSVELYDADEVPDEWLVATIGGVGAPSVLAEKGINGCEITNLLAAQEEQLGRKLDAIVLSEIGGMNSVIPVAAAAIAGIPLVNVDGMGRAFPGLQQDSYNIAGVHTWPMAFADEKGNVAMLTGGTFASVPALAFLDHPFFLGPVNGIVVSIVLYVAVYKLMKLPSFDGPILLTRKGQ